MPVEIGNVYKVKKWLLLVIEEPQMYNGKMHARLCVIHHNDTAANTNDLRLHHKDYPGYDGYTVMGSHKISLPTALLEKVEFKLTPNHMKHVFMYMLADHTFNPIRMSIRKLLRDRLREDFYPTPNFEVQKCLS